MAEITLPDQDLLLNKQWVPPFRDVAINRSEWSKTSRSFGMNANGIWTMRCELRGLAREVDKRPWRLFWQRAADKTNFFRVRIACSQVPPNIPYTGTAMSTGGAGGAVGISGMPAATPAQGLIKILEPGQYVTIQLTSGRRFLATVAAQTNSSTTGNGVCSFIPSAPDGIPAGVPIEIDDPYVPMRLLNPETGFSETGGILNMVFELEENV